MRVSRGKGLPGALIGACSLALLASSATASAATRFAEPGGDGPEPCAQVDPCGIQEAVEGAGVAAGDEVVLQSGDYFVGSDEVTVASAIDVHGTPGNRPRIVSTANAAMNVNAAGARVSDIFIDHAGGSAALGVSRGTVERVVAKSSSTISTCGVGDFNTADALLRDSVCWNTSSEGEAVSSTIASGVNASVTSILRNVTAVASGASAYGIRVFANGVAPATNVTVLIDAKNVIVSGGAGDILAETGSNASATVNLTHSNYATQNESGAGAVITDPGTSNNQTAEPVFNDAASSDFHQAATSPTINAGTVDSQLGAADLDGEPRDQGGAPDIGADEFDQTGPIARIDSGPDPGSFISDATPAFGFSSTEGTATFGCQIDGTGGFAACVSPYTTEALADGAHSFEVRGVDAGGNGGTPASVTFTVDTRDPQTRITKDPPRRTERHRAKFGFRSSQPGSDFECKLDRGKYRDCESPFGKRVDSGSHRFRVRAIDPAGNVDRSPAKDRWRVLPGP